jgi:hypothetical protein
VPKRHKYNVTLQTAFAKCHYCSQLALYHSFYKANAWAIKSYFTSIQYIVKRLQNGANVTYGGVQKTSFY